MNGYDKPKALTMHEIELIIDTHRKFPKMTAEGIGTHVGQIMSDEYNDAHKAEIENDFLPPKHYRLTDTCVSSYITAVEVISKGEPYKGCNISKVAMNEYAKKHGLPEPTYINRPLKRKAPKQITVEELCPLEENNKPEEHEPAEHDSVAHNPLVEGAPAYFVNRTDDVICQRIADVAIQAISALLEIHKRGRD